METKTFSWCFLTLIWTCDLKRHKWAVYIYHWQGRLLGIYDMIWPLQRNQREAYQVAVYVRIRTWLMLCSWYKLTTFIGWSSTRPPPFADYAALYTTSPDFLLCWSYNNQGHKRPPTRCRITVTDTNTTHLLAHILWSAYPLLSRCFSLHICCRLTFLSACLSDV